MLTINTIASCWKDEPDTAIWLKEKAQANKNPNIRENALQLLVKGWHNNSEIFEFLSDCAVNDPFIRSDNLFLRFKTNPRQTALQAITEYFPHHPQTKDLLSDRA